MCLKFKSMLTFKRTLNTQQPATFDCEMPSLSRLLLQLVTLLEGYETFGRWRFAGKYVAGGGLGGLTAWSHLLFGCCFLSADTVCVCQPASCSALYSLPLMMDSQPFGTVSQNKPFLLCFCQRILSQIQQRR